MKCIIDTNVPVKASYSLSKCKEEDLELVGVCMDFIHGFINDPEAKLVLDMDWEIVHEYERNLKDTDMGREFRKWLYTYMSRMDMADLVRLSRRGDDYCAFPKDAGLKDFDIADRKFVALAIEHSEKPPIVQAADGKWLGFQDRLEAYGVHIEFLDMEYARNKYNKKIRDKRR